MRGGEREKVDPISIPLSFSFQTHNTYLNGSLKLSEHFIILARANQHKM